jgi:LuxR family quorum-sensing transcriptional regulator LasR/LuxR family quorum-sensing system transcriptional regulator CciR
MLSQQQLLDLGLSPDVDTLRSRLTSAAHELGFGLFSAVLIRGAMGSANAWMLGVGNTPDAYVVAQQSLSDALRDPVIRALRSNIVPVLYDQSTYVEAGAVDLWDLQASFGYRCGVACSVHEPSHLEQFLLGFDRPDALPIDPVVRMRLQAAVQMVTLHAQSALQRISTPTPAGSPVLDAGELESLRWAKDGYTAWQVGQRMVISQPEVARRQRSAARKLGASSVQGAVLTCIQGGLID